MVPIHATLVPNSRHNYPDLDLDAIIAQTVVGEGYRGVVRKRSMRRAASKLSLAQAAASLKAGDLPVKFRCSISCMDEFAIVLDSRATVIDED